MMLSFDPAAWLRDFKAVGGLYFVADDKLITSCSFVAASYEPEARQLVNRLTDRPELVEAVIDALEQHGVA